MPELNVMLILAGAVLLSILLLVALLVQRMKWKKAIMNLRIEKDEAIHRVQLKAESDIKALTHQSEEEIQKEREQTKRMIDAERKKCAEMLRIEREKIACEKENLMMLSATALMVRTVMALGGYGTRLDRIEKGNHMALDTITGIRKSISEIQQVSVGFENMIEELQQKVIEATESIESKCDIESALELIQSISSCVEELGENWDYSKKLKLDEINERICEIDSRTSMICDDVSYIKTTVIG